MKVEVRPVTGASFEVDGIELSMTVQNIKEKISQVKGAGWEPDLIKLIVKGKIMADASTLGDYGYQEGSSFLVCMLSKPKKSAAPPVSPQKPAVTTSTTSSSAAAATVSTSTTGSMVTPSSSSSSTPSVSVRPPIAVTPQIQQQQQQVPSAPVQQRVGPPMLASNEEVQASLAMLKDMGFPEDQCKAALTAAYGNTDRAVEYLMNGIPQLSEPPMMPPSISTPSASQPSSTTTSTSTTTTQQQQTSGSVGGLAALRRSPLLNQLKRIVQNDPSKLGDILQQLSVSDPALFAAIQADQAGFVAIMNEPIVEGTANVTGNRPSPMSPGSSFGDLGSVGEGGAPSAQQLMMLMQAYQSMPPAQRLQLAQMMQLDPQQLDQLMQMMQSMPPEQMLAGMGGGSGMGGGAQGGYPPGTQVVHLTQAQLDAVARLQELGFSRRACVEALLSCDNNEEMAANLLLMNPPQMDEDDDNDLGDNNQS